MQSEISHAARDHLDAISIIPTPKDRFSQYSHAGPQCFNLGATLSKDEQCEFALQTLDYRMGPRIFALSQSPRALGFSESDLISGLIRDAEELASVRQCDPGITHPDVIFTLFWIIYFLRKRCASRRCLPCGLASWLFDRIGVFPFRPHLPLGSLHTSTCSLHDASGDTRGWMTHR